MAQQGLYGSDIGKNIARVFVAELVGTFFLVLAGTAVATAYAFNGTYTDLMAIALSFGFVLVALVAALGHVSGAHFNPAVTIGLAATRQFPWRYTPFYLLAQVGGSCLAALSVWYGFGGAARSLTKLGATFPAVGVGTGQAIFIEALITFLLVFVIVAVATDERVPKSSAPLAAGLALAVAVFIGGPLTGGAANPARALGPMIVANSYTNWWIYVVGPIVGGVIASLLYRLFLVRAAEPSNAMPPADNPEPESLTIP